MGWGDPPVPDELARTLETLRQAGDEIAQMLSSAANVRVPLAPTARKEGAIRKDAETALIAEMNQLSVAELGGPMRDGALEQFWDESIGVVSAMLLDTETSALRKTQLLDSLKMWNDHAADELQTEPVAERELAEADQALGQVVAYEEATARRQGALSEAMHELAGKHDIPKLKYGIISIVV